MLISDFQKTGWSGAEDVHFGDGDHADAGVGRAPTTMANIAVPSVTFARSTFSNQERITVTAGIANKSARAGDQRPGDARDRRARDRDDQTVNVGANASTSVTFAPVHARRSVGRAAVVKAGTDALPADNTFDFVLTPSQIGVGPGRRQRRPDGLELLSDQGAGDRQRADVPGRSGPGRARHAADARASDRSSILNDTMLPPGLAGGALKRFVETRRRPAGRLRRTQRVAGQRSRPAARHSSAPSVDRTDGRGAHDRLPRLQPSGVRGLQGAAERRLLRRARPALPRARAGARRPRPRALRRWRGRGGGAARRHRPRDRLDHHARRLVERPRAQAGLPAARPPARPATSSQYEQVAAWPTVGQVVDLSPLLKTQGRSRGRHAVAASGVPIRRERSGHARAERARRLRDPRRRRTPSARPDRIAVNLDPAESDLTPLDPGELVAAVTGRATQHGRSGRRGAAEADARRGRKASEPLVVSAARRPAAAGRRDGRRQPAVAQRALHVARIRLAAEPDLAGLTPVSPDATNRFDVAARVETMTAQSPGVFSGRD